MTMTHRENIPFFNDLPEKAVKAASRLWDAIHQPAYNGVVAYNDFVQDLTFAGITAPPRSVVKRWLAGVQAGGITRPGELGTTAPVANGKTEAEMAKAKPGRKVRRPADGASDATVHESSIVVMPVQEDAGIGHLFTPPRSTAPTEEAFEKLKPATFGGTVFSTLMGASITPPDLSDGRPDPALVLVARQMIEEEVARVNLDVRATARANVAARFRQIAADLERTS